MPRLPEYTEREAVPESGHFAFDYLLETRGAVRRPFSATLANPHITYYVGQLGRYVRYDSALDDKVRELATLVAAREIDAPFEWSSHARSGKEVGISQETIDIIGQKRDTASLSDDEALPINFSRELLRDHKVSDATWKAAQARFGDSGVLDLATTAAYYAMIGYLFNAIELEPAPATTIPLPAVTEGK